MEELIGGQESMLSSVTYKCGSMRSDFWIRDR